MVSRDRRARRLVYKRRRWQMVRFRALCDAQWRCSECGRAGRLEVHHVKPLAEGGAAYDLANLRVLCRPCHFRAEPGRRTPRVIWREVLDAVE